MIYKNINYFLLFCLLIHGFSGKDKNELTQSPVDRGPAQADDSILISSTCSEEILQSFPREDDVGCRPFQIMERNTNTYIDQVTCRFSNDLNLYIYSKKSVKEKRVLEFLDIKGLSFENIAGLENATDHSESFKSCSKLKLRIRELSKLHSHDFSRPNRHPLQSEENIGLMTSEHLCRILKKELDEWVTIYKNENRALSKIICVPQSIVKDKNPAKILEYLQGENSGLEALIIVGSEIVPFEIFAISPSGQIIEHGQTDLPYGTKESSFWNRPVSKLSDKILGKVYHSDGNIYRSDFPSQWAYDLNQFHANNHNQLLWISRFIASDLFSPEKLKESIQYFLKRRKKYQVPDYQTFLYVEGAKDVMFRPNYNSPDPREEYSSLKLTHPENEFKFLQQVDLEATLTSKKLKKATIVEMSEHGTPVNIGNFKIKDVQESMFEMDFLSLSACSTGYWGILSPSETSLVGAILGRPLSPLAIMAPQANTYMATAVGDKKSNYFKEGIFDNWESSMSLGSGQKKLIQSSLEYWKSEQFIYETPHAKESLPSLYLQLFSTPSIFGDGSIEN